VLQKRAVRDKLTESLPPFDHDGIEDGRIQKAALVLYNRDGEWVESESGMRRICVFCGSNAGARSEYAEAARTLAARSGRAQAGHRLRRRQCRADGRARGRGAGTCGEVIGVIPQSLLDKEVGHRG